MRNFIRTLYQMTIIMKSLSLLILYSCMLFSQSADDLYQRGLQQLQREEFQKAASTFQSLVESDNKNAKAWCGLGRALDALDSGSAEAERAFNQAIRRNRRYGEAYYYRGVMSTHRTHHDKEAIEELKLAVHFSPHMIEAWELLGYLHEQNANEKPAVMTFSDALLENPENESIYFHFLRTAFTYQYEKIAIKTLNKLLEKTTNPGRVKVDLADAHRRIGDTKTAESIFYELDTLDLLIPECHGNIVKARVLFDLEQDNAGCDVYWAAIEAGKDSADRKELFENLCFIMQNDEYNIIKHLPNDSLSTFYHRFWQARDPNLATPLNERIPEHFRRLTKAETEWR